MSQNGIPYNLSLDTTLTFGIASQCMSFQQAPEPTRTAVGFAFVARHFWALLELFVKAQRAHGASCMYPKELAVLTTLMCDVCFAVEHSRYHYIRAILEDSSRSKKLATALCEMILWPEHRHVQVSRLVDMAIYVLEQGRRAHRAMSPLKAIDHQAFTVNLQRVIHSPSQAGSGLHVAMHRLLDCLDLLATSQLHSPPRLVCSNPSCGHWIVGRCGKCRAVCYCSRRCQRLQWPTHKYHCWKIWEGAYSPPATVSKPQFSRALQPLMNRFV